MIAAVLIAVVASAQNKPVYEKAGNFYVSAQGGALFSYNDNTWTYRDFDKSSNLITPQASVAAGYYFNEAFGARLSVNYGQNKAAYNLKQTADRRFRPYDFNSVSVFADAILDLNGLKDLVRRLSPRIYGGIGLGHSFGFDNNFYYAECTNGPDHHPWQEAYLSKSNTVVGFRFGGILEYTLPSGLGFFVDVCGEAYTDRFDGIKPTSNDQDSVSRGYAGFPFDCRGIASFGVSFNF